MCLPWPELLQLFWRAMAETLRIWCLFAMQEMAGTVGPPLPCTAFRLEAVPEMNYNPGAIMLMTS